jgi:peptide/nickel transport system permease protein
MSQLFFVVRRLLIAIPVMIGLITIAFVISHIIPGDPAALAAGEGASQETIERIRRDYGLDQPLIVQYIRFWRDLSQGDLGRSLMSGRRVSQDIVGFFPATLELSIVAFTIAATMGVTLGVLAARNHGNFIDRFLGVFSIAGIAIPKFWLALLLQLLFGLIGILPLTGRLGIFTEPPKDITGLYIVDSLLTGNWPVLKESIAHIILPAVSLSFTLVAIAQRMTRANVLDVIGKDYVFNARATAGLPYGLIHYKYTLKNALIPVVAQLGLNFGFFLSGNLLVETVFNWPGIGLYIVRSAVDQDFRPILGGVIVTGVIYVSVNLVAEITYGLLDPRIRQSRELRV